jgi:alkanesulfonate monooxygenase SsuD/methylene tetrahydromethanopterin reductase-like flavin-dependent oxidoreductase (luciferase family)
LRFGLALPQYDYSTPTGRIDWPTVLEWGTKAEELGFDSVWFSDHLFLDVGKYGGDQRRHAAMESFTTMAALAARTSKIRLGILVACNDLRPPALVAKMTSALDVLSDGRFELGLGAGWYEPEYEEAGVPFQRPGRRIERLEESARIVTGMLSTDRFSFHGKHYQVESARNLPLPSRPPTVWIGGKGDRVVSAAGRYAGGYNSVWAWTPQAYRGRMEVLERAARSAGRNPWEIRRSVGLYCLPGRDEAELEKRWQRYVGVSPDGTAPSGGLTLWSEDKLVGNRDQMSRRIGEFQELGVVEVILGFGILPFQIADETAVDFFAKEVISN